MDRLPGTDIKCYQCGHEWKNKFTQIRECPKCLHKGFNWKQSPDLEGEIWKRSTLLGRHEISNYGRLKSTIVGNGMYVGKIIKGSIDRCGYIRYSRNNDTVFVHVLVAHEFIGPKPEGYECNHKDCNKLNNRDDNLEYLTIADHKRHSKEHDLLAFGERHGNSKLTEKDVLSILALKGNGLTHSIIGKMFGVDESNISCITRGTTWRRTVGKYANQTI